MAQDATAAGPGHPLAERLRQSEMAALDLYVVYLGERLGLYQALAEGGPATPAQLAVRTGTAERYVREWLEHQAVAGLIDVHVEEENSPTSSDAERRYVLPAEHVEVLVDRDSLSFSAHKAIDIVRASRRLPELVEAFRTGGGIPPLPWEPEGRADFNRPRFVNLLGKAWLPSIPEVHERLTSDPPARVADVACGTGWSSIAMAQAYTRITVDGFDLDEAAIERATGNAREEGVADRVAFRAADAADPGFSGRYDLATIFEALHDMSRPVEALRAARSLLDKGGWLLVADELVDEEFSAQAGDRERYVYGWSVVSCLPDAMGDPGTAATGAVMRPATLRAYALEAGFEGVEVLPIETEFWRFYRLIP
ncbi:MAG: methyltransferase domain-containing protein [Actinomycetota bacterium]|nr:methyltransferase domain-containing protein [Actinomycetota bacterium]